MIKAKDIKNADDLKVWLDQFPVETLEDQGYLRSVAVKIVHRAVARVLPLEGFFFERARLDDLATLPFLRCHLIAFGASIMPPEELTDFVRATAAFDATYVLYEGYDDDIVDAAAAINVKEVTRCAANAARNVLTPIKAFYAVRAAFCTDCMAIEAGEDIMGLQLWPEAENPLVGEWENLRDTLRNPGGGNYPDGWDFWIDFYERQLSGHTLPIDLIKEITVSDDIDWKSDGRTINQVIYDIRQRYARREDIAQTS
ncbi:hypothetical protein [Halocynthiibacter sp.]|uniref:hypothetical protein n=1 Tax=Halocynthiibacter sp. TaxID=1979210 RepID=UPI003C3F010E